jgi:hypothetical protein
MLVDEWNSLVFISFTMTYDRARLIEFFVGMWESLSSFFGTGTKKPSPKKKPLVIKSSGEDEKIHVFSLATGHLYERLLRIMMLSVSKRTSLPVKVSL